MVQLNPDKYYIGSLCKNIHTWNGESVSLRCKSDRSCYECKKEISKRSRNANIEKYREKNRARYRSPEGKEYVLKYRQTEARKASQRKHNASEKAKKAKLEWEKSKVGKLYRQSAEYKAKVREKNLKYAKTIKGKEVISRARHRYKESNKDILKQKSIVYRSTERAKILLARTQQRRIARKRNNHLGISSPDLINKLKKSFNGVCAYCRKCEATEVDHFIPVSFGGSETMGNFVPCCRSCNSSKGNKDAQEWFETSSFYSKKAWKAILVSLGKNNATIAQLPLI